MTPRAAVASGIVSLCVIRLSPLIPITVPEPDLLEQVELLVRSRYGLVIVDTLEEERVEELFKQIASKLQLHYYSWTRSRGWGGG